MKEIFIKLLIVNTTINIKTGTWKAVELGVKIPHNLQTTPLRIKTNSAAGSEEKMEVTLYTAGRDDSKPAGWVFFKFSSPPQYSLGWCMDSIVDLPSELPRDINKEWVITKFPGPRITVQCNEVTVLDFLLSNDTCNAVYWNDFYGKQTEQIKFDGKAPDEYWVPPPGQPLTVFNISCLL